MSCCFSPQKHDGDDDEEVVTDPKETVQSDAKEVDLQKRIPVERPTTECEGYPPSMLPDLADAEQVDFYIPKADGGRLACSLVKRPGGSTATQTFVQEGDFEIDSTTPVVIFCHGSFSWRNQMMVAHLAGGVSKGLECHTLRFDFQGNGGSSGEFLHEGNDRELDDLKSVIKFVQSRMKCRVACVAGHSKSVYSVLRVAAGQEEGGASPLDPVPCFVNLSGRYAVPKPGRTVQKDQITLTPAQLSTLEREDKVFLYDIGWRKCEITMADVEEYNEIDSSFVRRIKSSKVMTIHGSKDVRLDVSSAYKYDGAIEDHVLKIIEGGNHSFNGLLHMPKLVSFVSDFVRQNGMNQ